MTLAMVKVLPEPVTPSSTWCFCPSFKPSNQLVDCLALVSAGREAGAELELRRMDQRLPVRDLE